MKPLFSVSRNGLYLLTILILTLTQDPGWCQTMTTVAGTGKPDMNGFWGDATKLNVGYPFGVEIGPDDALYITEVWNHRVLRLDRKTGLLSTVAGCGRKGYSGNGGAAADAELNEPYEVRFDKEGNMYFVEMRNHLIRRVDAKTRRISTVAGVGRAGFAGDGGPATKAQFNNPHSLVLDDRGMLYVADIGNHRIRRVNLKTGNVDTIAGTGERRMPRDRQIARGNPLLGPRALFLQQNTMWIALREGHSVWRLDLQSGQLRHVAGTGKKGYLGDKGPAINATFDGPKGIAIGSNGNVFVADTENNAIRRIDLKTGLVTTVGGGRDGSQGDGGPPTQAGLKRPHGICVDNSGAIYIGDTLNHRVRRIGPPNRD